MDFAGPRDRLAIQVVRGPRAIFESRAILSTLAERSGQREVLADSSYFLGKPGLLKRTPVLFLLRRPDPGGSTSDSNLGPLVGAVLLFHYSVAGLPSRMYTSNDRSGRRNVVALPEDRPAVASRVAEYLLEQGAHVVMLSFRSNGLPEESCSFLSRETSASSWVARHREIADYLSLGSTFDETLASIGKRTRTHMRYYRRRAEADLGCTFDPNPSIGLEDVLAFNKECMYALPDEVVRWRLRVLEQLGDPILFGMRDGAGRWLSLLGGRRLHGDSEVFWQMNRSGFPAYSLSLVMRTYLIEHEVSRGAQRLYLDGGSSHSLCRSFVKATVTDVAALRRSPLAYLTRKLARRLIPWDNELAHLLVHDEQQAADRAPRNEKLRRIGPDTACPPRPEIPDI